MAEVKEHHPDKELLELAAKAAGVDGWYWRFDLTGEYGIVDDQDNDSGFWNPLEDDADALRLAVRLGISIEPYPIYDMPKHSVIVKQRRRSDMMRERNPTEVIELYGDDADAAARLAIVKCAAKIGELMS